MRAEGERVACPRAGSDMTPCVARDGSLALTDGYYGESGWNPPVCVGCGYEPRPLLHDLAKRHPPARRYMQTKDAERCADRLKEQVAEYVAPQPPLARDPEWSDQQC